MQCKNLEEVRENIDRIDDEIIQLIAERGTYVIQASNFKKDEEGVKDTARVEKVIQKVRAKAQEYGANQDMVEAGKRNSNRLYERFSEKKSQSLCVFGSSAHG